MNVRQVLEQAEEKFLSPLAQKAGGTRGRLRPEPESEVRTCFQRDRDRIIHSKSFRRLKDKTQVFLAPEGDHYRTRLTHTLEVAQIGRTIARALRLNEDLTEAIALGHDLGHTPFGHAGERVLEGIHPGGFSHNRQSLRIVDHLERGTGLNLTWEVRDGILNHPGEMEAFTLEGKIIKLADRVAYINHDIDDAIRAKIISEDDLPRECRKVLGESHSQRINTLVKDIITASWDLSDIAMSPEVREAMLELRTHLFKTVYFGSPAKVEEAKVEKMLTDLYRYLVEHPEFLPSPPVGDPHQAVCDFVSGMTDRFAVNQYQRFFVPGSWRLSE